jgi:hypothetical protein
MPVHEVSNKTEATWHGLPDEEREKLKAILRRMRDDLPDEDKDTDE